MLLPNKAPGFDCLDLDIFRDVLHYHPLWLLNLYNQCVREPSFPQSGKRGIPVYFPKEENFPN